MIESEQNEKPHNSTVGEWMGRIRDGRVGKPRWQRGVVWDDEKIEQLFQALMNRRPVGALLTMNCLNSEQDMAFEPIALAHAPQPDECELLLLDGQQRLTALWSVFDSVFSSGEAGPFREFFVRVGEVDGDLDPIEVLCVKKNKQIVPNIDKTGEELILKHAVAWECKLVPLSILAPHIRTNDDEHTPIVKWCDSVFSDSDRSRRLEWKLNKLSRRLNDRDISDYRLASDTKREDAINAFIRTNESSATISRFDIAVAEIEKEIFIDNEHGLREKIRAISIDESRQSRFFGPEGEKRIPVIGELILKVGCLLCRLIPTDRSYTDDRVIRKVGESWDEIVQGIDGALEIIETECIYDNRRLPTEVPLRVIPALLASEHHPRIAKPSEPDKIGASIKLIRSYLWRSFLTGRYDRQANQRLFEDFLELEKDLCRICNGQSPSKNAKVLDNDEYPYITEGKLATLSRYTKAPTTKNKQSRAIFACTLRDSARDFASDDVLTIKNVYLRQYHHLFPRARLIEAELIDYADHPLNFVLVSGITNRKIAAKKPLDYLKQRLKDGLIIEDEELAKRVQTHVVPYDELNVGNVTKHSYQKFIEARASVVSTGIEKLCEGIDWHPT